MRKLSLTLSVALAMTATVALCAPHHIHHAAPADQDFAFIRQAYAYEADGASHMDVNKQYSYTTDDYTVTLGQRVSSKAGLMERSYQIFKECVANGATLHWTTEVLSLEHEGDTIVATVHIKIKCNLAVDDFVNGSGNVTADVDRFETDTWVPTPDGWACQKGVIADNAVKLKTPE
jgi:hypothetical protein